MKRITNKILSLLVLAAAIVFAACEPDPFEPDYELMIGTWKNGTEYMRYYDHSWQYEQYGGTTVEVNGTEWDTSVDEGEAEALPFRWELEGTELLRYHYDYMGAVVPKSYTVTALSTSQLTYKDKYGRTYTYSKVQ